MWVITINTIFISISIIIIIIYTTALRVRHYQWYHHRNIIINIPLIGVRGMAVASGVGAAEGAGRCERTAHQVSVVMQGKGVYIRSV